MAFYWLSYRLERFRNSIQFGNLSQFPHFRVPWSQVPAKSVRARLQPHFLPTFYPPIFSPPFLRIVFLACLSEGVHVSRHYERLVPQFESRSWTGSCSALAALTHDQKMRTIALMIDRATMDDPVKLPELQKPMQLDIFPQRRLVEENIVIRMAYPSAAPPELSLDLLPLIQSHHACSYSSRGFRPLGPPRLWSTRRNS